MILWAQHEEEAEVFGWSMHILYQKERFFHIPIGIVRLEKWHIHPFGILQSLTIALKNPPGNGLAIKCALNQ